MSFMQRETILKSNTGNFQDSVPVKLIKADNTLKIIFENENSVLTEPNMTLCVFLQNKSFVERQLAPGAGQLIMSPFSWPLDGVIGLAVIQGEPSGCRFVLRGNLGREINWPDLIFFYQAKHQKKKQNQPSKQESIQKGDTAGQKAPVMNSSDHAKNSTPPAKSAVKPSHQPPEAAEKSATAAKLADQPSQQVSGQNPVLASSGNIPSPKNDGTRQPSSPVGNISSTGYMAPSPHSKAQKYQVNDSTITQNQNRKDSSRENQSLDQKGQSTSKHMAQKDQNSVESPRGQSSPGSLIPKSQSSFKTGNQNKSYTRSAGEPAKTADSPLADSTQQPVVHHRDVLAQKNRQRPVNSPNHRGLPRNDAKSNQQALSDDNPPKEQNSNRSSADGQPREKEAENSTAASSSRSPKNISAKALPPDAPSPVSKPQHQSPSAALHETSSQSAARPAIQSREFTSSKNGAGKHRELSPSKDITSTQSVAVSTVQRKDLESLSSHTSAQQSPAPCLQEERQIIVAEPFSHIFPNAHWYKVTYPLSRGKWHYLLGEIYHNNKMVLKAVAVPGKYSMSSPSWLKGFDTFFISKENQAGYWLLFEDAQTGHIVYDYKSYFTSE